MSKKITMFCAEVNYWNDDYDQWQNMTVGDDYITSDGSESNYCCKSLTEIKDVVEELRNSTEIRWVRYFTREIIVVDETIETCVFV